MSTASHRERHQKMYEIFTRACTLDRDQRAAFLVKVCGSDAEMRRDIEALLAEDVAVESSAGTRGAGAEIGLSNLDLPRAVRDFVSRSGDFAAALDATRRMPERIGRYRIVSVLGEGGMGMVFRAEQDHPRRTVALKVIRSDYASERTLRRFEVEAQALALLHHQGIAQIYEAGTFQSEHGSQPYFAMELIEGPPLLEYAERNQLGTRERLTLMMRLCDAVEHAHRKGVIHRDLKPGNILVVENGSSMGSEGSRDQAIGQPKILDFGVARVTDLDVQATAATQSGQILGTLAYMSPEQVAGDSHGIDTRADVYALGVIAYELLTGRLPYAMKGRLIHEAVRVIQEDEPTPLSSINRLYRGDLDTILAKTLEKDKSRRYGSAASFGEDIRRYLHDEPIIARKPSTLYQLQKFARRNMALVVGIVAVFVVLVLGIIGTSYGLREALNAAELAAIREKEAIAARDAESEQRTLLEHRERELREVVSFQGEMLAAIDPEAFGQSMTTRMRERLESALHEESQPEDEMTRSLAQFDGTMRRINSTDLARDLLDAHLLRRSAEAIESAFVGQPRVVGTLRRQFAVAYHSIGRFPDALGHAKAAVEILQREIGPDDPDAISAVSDLAIILRAVGEYERAEAMHREAFERRERVLGKHHPKTIQSMTSIAMALRSQGRLDEAEEQCRAALDKALAEFGEEHVETLRALNSLAVVLRDQGRTAEAEPHLRQVLEIRRRVFGPEHPDSVGVMANLAGILIRLGQLEESERLHLEVLESLERRLGEYHPNTLRTCNNLATLLLRQGRLETSERYYRRAVEGRRRALGTDHPNTLLSQANLGKVLMLMGRLEEAETMLIETSSGLRNRLGEEHVFALVASGTLGAVLREQGRYAEAEALLLSTLEGFRRSLGPAHPYTMNAMEDLGLLYLASGDPENAERLLGELAGRSRGALPADHADLGQYLLHHGRALTSLRRFEAAESALREAADILISDDIPAARQRDVAAAMVELYTAWDEAEPGRGFDEEARRWQDPAERESG